MLYKVGVHNRLDYFYCLIATMVEEQLPARLLKPYNSFNFISLRPTLLIMNAIRINVNKQMDGYSFSITPSIRDLIKRLFPNAHPANNIFVGYDTKSDFDVYVGKLENYIYPALLGVEDESDLKELDEIHFIDTQTGKILHKVTPRDEKV